MKNVFLLGAFVITSFVLSSFTMPDSTSKEEITWYSWDEAIELQKTSKKKVFIDVYTDWCGWCKRMDKSTFKDEKVIKYMNEHFIAIKLDAEQKGEITYADHTFKFVEAGRRGYHELAYSLLDGRMGYPAFVYLDETQKRITISPGYKDANTIMTELEFIADNHFKTTNFKDFQSSKEGK